MKLIVAGATGFVATEVIRQSLRIKSITSVVALARRPVTAPPNLDPGVDVSKLHSVTIKDYDEYSEDAIKQFADADACIWTVAITPSKSKKLPFDEVRHVCLENTLVGIKAMVQARQDARAKGSFRFMYMSGAATERDQTKKPSFMPEYSLMRGETENQLLAFAAEHQVEVCVAKPGIILGPGQYLKYMMATVLEFTGVVPSLYNEEVVAAMLDRVVKGFDKESLDNSDLRRIGQLALKHGE